MARTRDMFLAREVGDDQPYEGELDGEVFAIRSGEAVYGIAGADGQAEAARKAAEEARAEAESARVSAEEARAASQASNDERQEANDAAQAANNAAAQGLQVTVLDEGQYDADTLEPTVDGQVGRMYFVPDPDAEGSYAQWMWVDSEWVRVGGGGSAPDPITTAEIDEVTSDQDPEGGHVLDLTGLSYLWGKVKAWGQGAFAALSHSHATSDVTGLDDALGAKQDSGSYVTFSSSVTEARVSASTGDNQPIQIKTNTSLGGRLLVCSESYIGLWDTDNESWKWRQNLDASGKKVGLAAYPVGAVYISNVSTSPASLFGGTWQQMTGVFPYFTTSTDTGGSNTKTLAAANIPSHQHNIGSDYDGEGSGTTNGCATLHKAGTSGAAHLIKTGAYGSASSFNNMPKYRGLYAWYRTA